MRGGGLATGRRGARGRREGPAVTPGHHTGPSHGAVTVGAEAGGEGRGVAGGSCVCCELGWGGAHGHSRHPDSCFSKSRSAINLRFSSAV